MRRVAGLVLIGAVLASIGCGGDGEPATVAETTAPVRAFAPLVVLDGREEAFPMGADEFLHASALEWNGGPCPQEVNIAAGPASLRKAGEPLPLLDPSRMGRAPVYTHRPLDRTCLALRRDRFASNQRTRPFDREDRPLGLGADEGFVLDILTDSQPGRKRLGNDGSLDAVPTYYATEKVSVRNRPGLRISYWLLFGQGVTTSGGKTMEHEGDWERIDIVAERQGASSAYVPTAVRLWELGRFETVPWGSMELAGSRQTRRPVVYLDPRSHTPATHPRAGGRVGSVQWKTWRRLRPVRDEAWYGYGGAWGAQDLTAGKTGPLGPSPFVLETGRP